MTNNELYYKRGLYMIDKLLNTYSNNSSFYKEREKFVEKEFLRYCNYKEIASRDIKSFTLTSLVALLGMNKENIERFDKNANYDFSNLSKDKLKEIKKLKLLYPSFEKDRITNTKYDSWLNVTNLNYPTIDYMFNVRNGLLHSEYGFYDDFENIIYIKNSNYTKFEGKILLPSFADFSIFYFGNSTWSGLSENTKIYDIKYQEQIKTKDEMSKILDDLKIINVEYKLKSDNFTSVSPELKLYNFLKKEVITEKNFNEKLERLYRNNSKEHAITTTALTEEQKILVKKMLKTYYGEDLYNMDIELQIHAIIGCINYLIDSRSLISEWISDFIKTFDFIEKIDKKRNELKWTPKEFYCEIRKTINEDMSIENGKRSVFACRTSLLIIKAYHILYRLQNKSFEDIDYNNITFDFTSSDYTYTKTDINGVVTINNFADDILKVKTKCPSLSDPETKNRVVSEIIRDALSHGKIDVSFKIDANNNLKEYIILDDFYHGKSRKIEMTLDKFEEYLLSEAFTSKYSKNKSLTKVITK